MKSKPLKTSSKHIFPGFKITLGYVLFYLSFLVLFPLCALVYKSTTGGWEHFVTTLLNDRVIASFQTTFGISFLASLSGGLGGGILAWVLTRYDFPGKQIVDALIDLPFALPTAVAGIALTSLYAPHGWIGSWLSQLGIKVAFTPLGIYVALLFIGIPFVVRTLQPVVARLSVEVEEAAACLGANRFQIFFKIIFPALLPTWITGMLLAFGRAVGEYGSVVFISGNLPFKTEILPLLIITKLEQYDYAGATAIGVVMLLFSVVIIISVNLFQKFKWQERK